MSISFAALVSASRYSPSAQLYRSSPKRRPNRLPSASGTASSKGRSRGSKLHRRPAAAGDGTLHASLVNGTDRQPFSSATFENGVLTLRMDYYDGQLTLRLVSPDKMEGEYSRQTSKGISHIPVALEPHTPRGADKPWTGPTLTGDWIFTWPQETGAEKTTLASFQQQKMADAKDNAPVTGIIEPVSGDSGLLHGIVFTANGVTHFHLSRFDGIQASWRWTAMSCRMAH